MNAPQSNGRLLLFVLAILFVAFVVYVFLAQPPAPQPAATGQARRTPQPQTVPPQPSTWGSSYYYGGMPRPKDFRSDNRTSTRVVSHSYSGSGYPQGEKG